MIRVLIALIISTWALAGVAWASDDYYDGDDLIIPRDSAPAPKDDASDTGDSTDSPSGQILHPGTYFGDGDPRQNGAYPMPESRYSGGVGITTSSRAALALGAGSEHQTLDMDQIYGPLWGVPEDAVGMESYQHYYDMLMLGNPEMLPEGYTLPTAHNHGSSDSPEPEAPAEQQERKQGLELANGDDW